MRRNDYVERSTDDGQVCHGMPSRFKCHITNRLAQNHHPSEGNSIQRHHNTSIYAPTTDYSDEKTDKFYDHLQKVIEQVEKKDILIVQVEWNAKVGEDAITIWNENCGTSCNLITNNSGLRLIEFASSMISY